MLVAGMGVGLFVPFCIENELFLSQQRLNQAVAYPPLAASFPVDRGALIVAVAGAFSL